MPAPDVRVGIDVGGTNTDAVALDRSDALLAKAKVPTTADVTAGITAALELVLAQLGGDRGRVTHVMLGTTQATNAILERRGLGRVALLRLGGPATHSIRPLFAWPADLRDTVSAGELIVDGGIEFDGREIVPLDLETARRFLEELAGPVDGVAVASVFAPVSAEHELAVGEAARAVLGVDVHVSLSHEIGTVGLLERENATVLNAALVGVARTVAAALSAALERHGLRPETFFAQNDGTLMALGHALRYPVLTIGSGPANSIRGAAYLTGARDAIVVDVGGTSTDVGVLAHGFPRESTAAAEIGGIRTNFRMPDLVSVALGGGSVVRCRDGVIEVGPDSVGYRLAECALVFGGATATLTDAAVATGRVLLGDAGAAVARRTELEPALARADAMLAEAVDRVKVAQGAQPLIVVGGGSVLVPDELPGVSEVQRPEHFDVANAIGAAIASVSGQVDRIFHPGPGGRRGAIDEPCDQARLQAARAGADPELIEIVEVEEIPLAYLT
ncbi:MAG: hydantoinase/oxoprolinase N-terminal domain-containing protein, partial [Gaiellaceae bacterium]